MFYGNERLQNIWYMNQFGTKMRMEREYIQKCIRVIGGGKRRYNWDLEIARNCSRSPMLTIH